MWVLVFLLLTPSPDEPPLTMLATFTTQAACQVERDRIGFEMAASYPEAPESFRIECRWMARRWKA